MSSFVHLRVRSDYSILNGVNDIESILAAAQKDTQVAVGLVDDMSLSGSLEFSTKATKMQIKPIVGSNVFLHQDFFDSNLRLPSIALLCQNRQGYENLIQILYQSQINGSNSMDQHFALLENIANFNDGLICLSGGFNGPIARYILDNRLSDALNLFESLFSIFGDRFYVELTRHGRKDEKKVEDVMVEWAITHNVPMVATNDVHFELREQFLAYDVACCIKDGRYLIEDGRFQLNAEYYYKSTAEMLDLFSDIPEAIHNSLVVAKRCSFALEGRKPSFPSYCSSKIEENELLRQMVYDGLKERVSKYNLSTEQNQEYIKRVDYELEVIINIGFSGYFLIVSDFVKWSKKNKIPVGPGRGSGAGSMVAWSLYITNVDPIKYGLLFERFLNPERVSMPDFDIDFCQTRREEVVEYVRSKYGAERVGSIMTFGKLQARAVLKDVGRVLHLPYAKVDEICKLIPFSPLEPVTLSKAIELDDRLKQQLIADTDVQQLIEIALELEGCNRHTSTHAAGIVIADNDVKKIAPVAIDKDTGLMIVAFNMKDIEKIGLVKFDFLGLKTLTMIAQTVTLIQENHNVVIDIDQIPLDDDKTFQLMRDSNVKGVFQLESPIPREALSNLSVDKIEDVVAITSLNRPGPMDQIPHYTKRKKGLEPITFLHPKIERLLSETYGIIIYQEQVIEIVRVLAGYSLGAADLFRRAMGKKDKAEMDRQKEFFVKGCWDNSQIDKEKAEEIFAVIEKFAGYGFNKSHALAYSVISYQTAYLKAHFAVEFFTSLLDLDIHNTDKLNAIIADVRANKIKIILPDINKSCATFTSHNNTDIIYALGALKSVGVEASKAIVAIRKADGPFLDIMDFAKRCGKLANKKQTESMIKANCFSQLHKNQKQLLESLETIVKHASSSQEVKKDESQISLFGDIEAPVTSRPSLAVAGDDFTPLEKISLEFEAVGFYLSGHPLDRYRQVIIDSGIVFSSQIEERLSGVSSADFYMAGVITLVKQRFGKRGRFAFVNLMDFDGLFESTIFNDDLITKNRANLVEGRCVVLKLNSKNDPEKGVLLGINGIFEAHDFFSKPIPLNSLAPVARKEGNYKRNFASNKSIDEFKAGDLSAIRGDIDGDKGIRSSLSFNLDYVVVVLYTADQLDRLMSFIRDLPIDNENGKRVLVQIGSKKFSLPNKYGNQECKQIKSMGARI